MSRFCDYLPTLIRIVKIHLPISSNKLEKQKYIILYRIHNFLVVREHLRQDWDSKVAKNLLIFFIFSSFSMFLERRQAYTAVVKIPDTF